MNAVDTVYLLAAHLWLFIPLSSPSTTQGHPVAMVRTWLWGDSQQPVSLAQTPGNRWKLLACRPPVLTSYQPTTWRLYIYIFLIFFFKTWNGRWPLPLVLVVLVAHGVVDGVVHHLLFHVHDFTLAFEVHHDLLNLRQFQLWQRELKRKYCQLREGLRF